MSNQQLTPRTTDSSAEVGRATGFELASRNQPYAANIESALERNRAFAGALRWAAVEAAQHAWRDTNPWHRLYTDLAGRAGKNPARAAVARKILIAAWHILSRQEPFKPPQPVADPAVVSASSRCFLAA